MQKSRGYKMRINYITLDDMFVYIHLEGGYVIRMTARCLQELGWKVGDSLK
jgi:hypothetical protein